MIQTQVLLSYRGDYYPISIALVAGYMVLWFVVLPIEIFVFDRKERKGQTLQKLTLKDLIFLPFGGSNPNAKIPRWISVPFLFILFLLLGIFVFILVMAVLAHLIA